MKGNDLNATTASSRGPTFSISIAAMLQAVSKMEDLRQRYTQSLAELAKVKCTICRRELVVVHDEFGEVVVVCQHVWSALHHLSEPVDSTRPLPPLVCTRFRLFDDDPTRCRAIEERTLILNSVASSILKFLRSKE